MKYLAAEIIFEKFFRLTEAATFLPLSTGSTTIRGEM